MFVKTLLSLVLFFSFFGTIRADFSDIEDLKELGNGWFEATCEDGREEKVTSFEIQKDWVCEPHLTHKETLKFYRNFFMRSYNISSSIPKSVGVSTGIYRVSDTVGDIALITPFHESSLAPLTERQEIKLIERFAELKIPFSGKLPLTQPLDVNLPNDIQNFLDKIVDDWLSENNARFMSSYFSNRFSLIENLDHSIDIKDKDNHSNHHFKTEDESVRNHFLRKLYRLGVSNKLVFKKISFKAHEKKIISNYKIWFKNYFTSHDMRKSTKRLLVGRYSFMEEGDDRIVLFGPEMDGQGGFVDSSEKAAEPVFLFFNSEFERQEFSEWIVRILQHTKKPYSPPKIKPFNFEHIDIIESSDSHKLNELHDKIKGASQSWPIWKATLKDLSLMSIKFHPKNFILKIVFHDGDKAPLRIKFSTHQDYILYFDFLVSLGLKKNGPLVPPPYFESGWPKTSHNLGEIPSLIVDSFNESVSKRELLTDITSQMSYMVYEQSHLILILGGSFSFTQPGKIKFSESSRVNISQWAKLHLRERLGMTELATPRRRSRQHSDLSELTPLDLSRDLFLKILRAHINEEEIKVSYGVLQPSLHWETQKGVVVYSSQHPEGMDIIWDNGKSSVVGGILTWIHFFKELSLPFKGYGYLSKSWPDRIPDHPQNEPLKKSLLKLKSVWNTLDHTKKQNPLVTVWASRNRNQNKDEIGFCIVNNESQVLLETHNENNECNNFFTRGKFAGSFDGATFLTLHDPPFPISYSEEIEYKKEIDKLLKSYFVNSGLASYLPAPNNAERDYPEVEDIKILLEEFDTRTIPGNTAPRVIRNASDARRFFKKYRLRDRTKLYNSEKRSIDDRSRRSWGSAYKGIYQYRLIILRQELLHLLRTLPNPRTTPFNQGTDYTSAIFRGAYEYANVNEDVETIYEILQRRILRFSAQGKSLTRLKNDNKNLFFRAYSLLDNNQRDSITRALLEYRPSIRGLDTKWHSLYEDYLSRNQKAWDLYRNSSREEWKEYP